MKHQMLQVWAGKYKIKFDLMREGVLIHFYKSVIFFKMLRIFYINDSNWKTGHTYHKTHGQGFLKIIYRISVCTF